MVARASTAQAFGAGLARVGKERLTYPQSEQKKNRLKSGAGVSALGLLLAGGLAGCGNQYRPVVSAINPVGPASQPQKFAVAVSNTSSTVVPNQAGLVTFVDFSGDTILSTPSIVSNPSYFGLDFSGVYGYTVNTAGVLENFALNNPVNLITSDIVQTQLAAGALPASITAYTVAGTSDIFIPEPGLSQVAVLSNPSSPSLVQSLSTGTGSNPQYVVGADGAERVYAILQGGAGVAAIEGTPVSISATIPTGTTPVYGVMTPDTRRAFILNKGSGTVSVINVVNNALDNVNPTVTLPSTPSGGAPNPVWADISPRLSSVVGNNQLVVVNQGNGTTPGTLTIINIPLCNQTAQANNPNCNTANPVDATGFGTIFKTATVGVNPVMVSILQDGSRAYVVNAGNSTTPGSVSVVSLTTGLVTATIPGDNTSTVATSVWGHPNSVAATTGQPTGKVYVTSGDSRYLTVIRTDTDTVDTHVTLQGTGVRVMVTAP